MNIPALFEQTYTFFLLIGITLTILFLFTFICIYVCVHRRRYIKRTHLALAKKRLLYTSPASITPQIPTKATDRYVFPLPKLENTETFPQYSLNEISSNYKTFEISKQQRRHVSSDSSYTPSSNHRRSYPLSAISLDAVKSKLHQIHRRSTPSPVLSRPSETINSEQTSISHVSDSDEEEDSESLPTPSFEYSLTELFRIELLYKLYYSTDDNQLLFQIIRLISNQELIERCFPILICKIRLFTNNDKHKPKKYFSKKNPINELFKFDLDQYTLEQSYLKIHVLGQHKNDKRLDLGNTSLLLNQYENLMIRIGQHHDGGLEISELHKKFIPIYEDRIDMITQQQITTENEARALICLVYENDRCLLHVGVIKILGIQSLTKPSTGHLHYRGKNLFDLFLFILLNLFSFF